MRKLLFQNFLLRQYLQRQKIAIVFEFDPHFLILTSFDPVVVNGMRIDLVNSAKILGLNISNDLKWNCHIDFIIKRAKKRLHGLSQLKRSGLGPREFSFSALVFARSQSTSVLS